MLKIAMNRIVWLVCLAAAGFACQPAWAASTILVYGDSLSAAYGIRKTAGWVALLQERLRDGQFDYTVVNASISGETSAGGAARIASALKQAKPTIVIVELGANDGLRGLPLAQLHDNLAKVVRAVQQDRSQVLLVGMRLPPNYGTRYNDAFFGTFSQLAREFRLKLVPFLLEGVAQRPDLFQADQLHPTEEAQRIILDNVWATLQPMLKQQQVKDHAARLQEEH